MVPNEPLAVRRQAVLAELASLAEIRRGSVVEQYVEAVGAKGPRRRGPYALYTRKDERQKTISRRLKSPQEVALYRRQIGDFRRFRHLVEELVRLGEQLSDAARRGAGAGAQKKTPRPPSKKTPRSPAS
jgi:hypothetical protein